MECRRLTGLLAAASVIAALVAGAVLVVAVPASAVQTATAPGFAPCSVITWLYDMSAQSRSGAGMIEDVGGALALVSDRTGVSFVEAPVMSPVVRITNVLGRTAARREQRALLRPGFSPGDLVTLEAMYPRAGCPAGSSW